MNPNQEQVLGLVRWAISTLGPLLMARGYVTEENWTLLSGVIVSIVPAVWTLFNHTQSNAVAVVAKMKQDPTSPVKGVIVEPTAAGNKMVAEVGPAVAMAGTPAATAIASH